MGNANVGLSVVVGQAALAAVVAVGCSSTGSAASSSPCKVDADCAARGLPGTSCINATCVAYDAGGGIDASTDGPVESSLVDTGITDPAWSCVSNVQWSPENPSTTVHMTAQVVYRGSGKPLVGASGHACSARDIACASPLDTQVSDANGNVTFSMPQFFRGYFEIIAPNAVDAGGDTLVPMLGFTFPPPSADYTSTIPVFPRSAWELVGSAIGTTVDWSLGGTVLGVLDCQGNRAAGVQLDVQPKNSDPNHPTAVGYVAASGVPVVSPAETSSNGGAGMVNVPPGTVTITATHTKLGRTIGTFNVPIRAGALTQFWVVPSP